jgi:hypothetical protein
METVNFVLGILCGTVLCGLCYVIVELLKINKHLKAKENEIAEAYRKFDSVHQDFVKTHDRIDLIDNNFHEEMIAIHRKIDENVSSIKKRVEEFKSEDLNREILRMRTMIEANQRKVSETEDSMKRYIDSRIDKAANGIALVAEGVNNYIESDEHLEKLLKKIENRRIEKLTEGLPVE